MSQDEASKVSEEILNENKNEETKVAPAPSAVTRSEEIRRQQRLIESELKLNKAMKSFAIGDYDKAIDNYDMAIAGFISVSKTRTDIIEKIELAKKNKAEAMVLKASQLMARAQQEVDADLYSEAISTLNAAKVVAPQREDEINAKIKDYMAIEEELLFVRKVDEEGIREIREEEVDRPNAIKFEQAEILFANRRYMDAKDVLEQILVANPFDSDAMALLRRVNVRVEELGRTRRKATREERLAQVEWEWNQPLRPSTQIGTAVNVATDGRIRNDDARVKDVFDKLNGIKIPSVVFDNDSLDSIVARLKQMSKDYDPDPVKRGVNIILRINEKAGASAPAEDAFGEEGGFEEGGFEEGAEVAASAPAQNGVSLRLSDVPILKIIELICLQQDLKYKVTEHAVIIADKSIPLDTMEVRFYDVPAGFLDLIEPNLDTAGASLIDDAGGGAGDGAAKGVRQYFDEFGVKFDAGSEISFIQSVNRLVVKNTPAEHGKIDRIIKELAPAENQIIIESKFYEINQDDIDELAFEWSIARIEDGSGFTDPNAGYIGRDPNYVGGVNGDPNGSLNDFLSDGFSLDKSGDLTSAGGDGLESAVRSLGSVLGAPGLSQGTFKFASILGDTTFNTLVSAIQQRSGEDVLNAPKVTTQNGHTAKIRVVQERYFPEEWEEPEVEQNSQGDGGSSSTVTPSKPVFGEPRDIGAVLTVTPQIDPDQRVIELQLKPEVIEFVEYDNSFNVDMLVGQEQTFVPIVGAPFTVTVYTAFEQKFSMPIFESRTVDTTVRVWDGETLALGGMISENKTTYEDKIPYLGDIPFLGRFFTSNGERSVKQNLIIFVTARLIDPSGLPVSPGTLSGLPDFKRL